MADGNGKTSSAKGLARKGQIIDITTRFLARNGSRGTSFADVAAEAGVSQAAVLYHFPTKEELLNAVLDRRDEVEDTRLWQAPDPGLEIISIMARNVTRWAKHPDMVGMHTVLVAENVGDDGVLHPRLMSRYRMTDDHIRTTLAAAQDRGEMRTDVDPRLKAIEIVAFINGLETAWLLDPAIPAAKTAAAWATDQVRALRA
jgi:AcrR family transcriptional regulator